ncbi:phosphatidylinositol-specific phospholipase C [Nocardia cerradoensis]|uniref:phosphatidylinositol-specific phospholipase C n=1 Tax=Nocardia cerradoensis TaxID=85688 RepID=UPI00030C6A3D|nr:phosphatidylinositol-specific phospholipase C [Nocardia cerradoensis]NKY45566.1 phosphatidylinositol-specific phospholipase C [Nocardia cerradoensis]
MAVSCALSSGCGQSVPVARPVAAAQSAPASAASGTESAGMPKAAAVGAIDHLDSASNPDWMGALPDSTPLSAMSIPGTHDTMSIHGGKAGPAVVTQEKFDTGCTEPACASERTASTQLEAGIRAFDIRVRRDEAGNLGVQHGSFYQQAGLDDVLRITEQFLDRHPRETILMRVKAECTNEDKTFHCEDAGGLPPDPPLLDRYLNAHPRVWRPAASGPVAIPRLGDVRGTLVVIRADGIDDRGLPVDAQDLWDKPTREDKWAAAATHLARAPAIGTRALSMDFLSASGVPDPAKFPHRYAEYENQHALDYLRSRPGAATGVVMADFPGPALVGEIIAHNDR